jgi:hypothetical protein
MQGAAVPVQVSLSLTLGYLGVFYWTRSTWLSFVIAAGMVSMRSGALRVEVSLVALGMRYVKNETRSLEETSFPISVLALWFYAYEN